MLEDCCMFLFLAHCVRSVPMLGTDGACYQQSQCVPEQQIYNTFTCLHWIELPGYSTCCVEIVEIIQQRTNIQAASARCNCCSPRCLSIPHQANQQAVR